MEGTLWGIIVLICGIFIASYGNVMFRFALAFMGFALGFSLVMWLGGGLDTTIRIVFGIVAGSVLALTFYMLVKFMLHIAGGVVGLVLMMALLGLFQLGGLKGGAFGWVLAVAAAIGGGLIGNRLGNMVVVLASALAGAYLVVLGLAALYLVGMEADKPFELLSASFPLVLFLSIFAISFLAQLQAQRLRQRFLR